MNTKMRNFNSTQYQKLFENWDDPVIKAHEKDEFRLIRQLPDLKQKIILDLGAGYGRILREMSPLIKKILEIEINPEMFQELHKRACVYTNVNVVKADITKLGAELKRHKIKVRRPVLLCLQNTLGTIEGDWRTVLAEMKKIGQKYRGEIVLSLYRQQALKDWGIMTYDHGQVMNGEPDLTKCDFAKGWFESKTGYTSKWWRDEEIDTIKEFLGGKVMAQIIKDAYWIIYMKF